MAVTSAAISSPFFSMIHHTPHQFYRLSRLLVARGNLCGTARPMMPKDRFNWADYQHFIQFPLSNSPSSKLEPH